MIDNQTTTHLHHTDSDGRPSGFALFLAPATILLAVAAVFFIPLFTGTNDLPGDLGDARFNIYILETVYLWMSGTGSPLLSPDMFFPFPYTLAFSDTHAATAWIYALFRIAGLDAYDAYKGWVAAGYVLTYLSAYYVGLRFSLSPFLASVAALAFAFSLPSVAQLGHAQLINMAATPFCFLYISRFSEKFASPDLLKFLVALCIQILINIYSGIFTLLISTIFLVVSVAFRHGLNTRAIGRAWADFGQSIRDERPAVPLLIVTLALDLVPSYWGFTNMWRTFMVSAATGRRWPRCCRAYNLIFSWTHFPIGSRYHAASPGLPCAMNTSFSWACLLAFFSGFASISLFAEEHHFLCGYLRFRFWSVF